MSDFDFGVEGYRAKLQTKGFVGKPIYIKNWPINTLLTNISHATRLWGADELVAVAKLDLQAAMRCATKSGAGEEGADLILHMIKSVTLDGKSLDVADLNHLFEARPITAIEIFMHVIHSQYDDFFASGLAGDLYPQASTNPPSKP